MKPSTTEFNLQPHYYLSEIELLILSLSFLFSKMNLVRKGISVYLVVSTVLSLELIYNKCYLIILPDSLIYLLSASERKGIKLEGSNSVPRE